MQGCVRAQYSEFWRSSGSARTRASRLPGRGAPPRGAARFARWAALVVLASSGCALVSGGPSLGAFQGQMLRTSDAGGIDALERMTRELPPVREWVERNGQPDYVLVASSRNLQLLYIDRDLVVNFRRPLLSSRFEAIPSSPIRSDDHMRFSNSDKERLARVRMGSGPERREPAERGRVLRRRVGSDGERGSSGGRP